MKAPIILLLTGLILFTGCDKFLDIQPKDKFIPTTVEDYENILNSMEVVSYGDYFADLLTDDAFLPEGEPGNLFSKQGLAGRRIYTFNKDVFSEGENDVLWSETYKRVFYFNTVINDILDATGGTEEQKRSIRAEALVGRAAEFLLLVNAYAVHYDPATAASDPGIPLVMRADISEKTGRNTVQETYDQIIRDAEEALPHLPGQPKITRFRASKAAATALLTRACLYMGDYAKAKQYADQTLQQYDVLADMNEYVVTIPGPFEYVPGAPLGWTNIPDGQHHPESILSRHFLRPFGLGMDVCASPDLAALFDNNDRRWVLYYANGWPPAPPFNYWTRYGVKIYLRGDYYNNCLSTPEVYLTRAESLARTGHLQDALNDLNKLRRHRISPAVYQDYTLAGLGNSADQILDAVLAERRRELAFHGTRTADLKRLNKEDRYRKTIVHTAEGREYVLEPNSPNYQRQIWPAAYRFNPDWQLNP